MPLTIREEYREWLGKSTPDINHVQEFLQVGLSDEPGELLLQLTEAESWFSRIVYLLADAGSFLERARGEFLPRLEGGTELNRKTALDAACADFRRGRNILEGLVEGLKQRVNLGQSILKFQRELHGPGTKPEAHLVD